MNRYNIDEEHETMPSGDYVLATDYDSLLAVLRQCVETMVLCESVDMGCLQDSDPCCHCAVCGRQDCTAHKDDCKLALALAAAARYWTMRLPSD